MIEKDSYGKKKDGLCDQETTEAFHNSTGFTVESLTSAALSGKETDGGLDLESQFS